MIIKYLNEAGIFGSYKKAAKQSNLDRVKRELSREATNHILEKSCDEIAELYLEMLNEVNLQTRAISSKYSYKSKSGMEDESNLLELSNYIINVVFNIPNKKEMQLNLIKNVYCNRLAIEYMISQGCFILPLIDTTRRWTWFNDAREIIPYKNMTKMVADAAEKIIKSHLSKFPSYTSIIPNKVKIILLQNTFNSFFNTIHRSNQQNLLLSYMGIKNEKIEFEYPGQGSSCLNFILDNFIKLTSSCTIDPVKSDEHIWKAIAEPSPWMFNKIVLSGVTTDISTVSSENFYSVKLLKFALDNDMFSDYFYINILINNVLKNIKYIKELQQEVSNNGLDKCVRYIFNDNNTYVESLIRIGKEITSEQAKQEGILIDSLKRRVYEFDYNDIAEVKSAAKDMIDKCFKFLTDAKIKKIAEDKMEEYLPLIMSKILESRSNSVSSSNKILLCDYHQRGTTGKNNIRVVIDPSKIEINKNNNLVFYIAIDFKIPVRGINPKYNNKATRQTHGKNYELITGKKIKIEIPL